MRKLTLVLLALTALWAWPLLGQEKRDAKADDADQMMAPEPLNDAWTRFFLGEWEGWSESPMGKSQDWERFELGLDGQFLLRHATSTMAEMKYTGMGAMTVNPQSGQWMGVWIDSFRGLYHGQGHAEGDVLTLNWEGYQGKYSQTLTKAGPNKITGTWVFTAAAGSKMEGRFEMTRKPATTDKKSY